MGRKRSYSDEELKDAVEVSPSVRQVINKLGMSTTGGGSYGTIKHHIARLSLDISHFTGRGHLKGKTHSWNTNKIPLEDILVENSNYHRGKLKARLIKNGLLKEECSICGMPDSWHNRKLIMVIDHINGVNDDHRIDNLRLVCPNCNSQLNTFSSRNKTTPADEKGKIIDPSTYESPLQKKRKDRRKKKYRCKLCNEKYGRATSDQKFCSEECYHEYVNTLHKCQNESCGKPFEMSFHRKKFCFPECYHASTIGRVVETARKVKDRPSKEELRDMIENMSWCAIGRKYDVSDNAVRKWARSYNLL